MLAQEPKPENQKARNDNAPDEDSKEQREADQSYSGPTILSRDKSLIGERGGKLLAFLTYAEVTGIYDSG